jgi:zinc/manganese transport system substrate-binding protein
LSARLPLLALGTASLLALSGCATAEPADDGILRIVTSTDVYADLVASVAGNGFEVESIIEGTVQDPHSYEATARDRLAIESADLVVSNGGGYDPFIDTILDAMDDAPHSLVAVDVLGLTGDDEHAEDDEHADDEHADDEHADDEHADHGHIEGVNEHVWYSLDGMIEFVHAIAEELQEIDEANASSYEANAEALEAELEELHERVEALGDEYADVAYEVVVTEPVAAYLLADAGLTDVTPESFAESIEEGTDISPAMLAAVLEEVEGGHLAFLAYNSQTSGAETELVRSAAEEAGVAIVDFSESLPEGESFVSWMASNIDAIESALAANGA